MKRKLDGFELTTEKAADKPLVRVKEPVLRYTNPARGVNADGAIFVWLAGDRPAAVGCLRVRPNGGVWREFTSLSDQALRCQRDGATVWSPAAGSFTKKPLPDGPKPAGTPALRLAQLRRQAERFAGDFAIATPDNWEALRRLPQPVYRYTADGGDTEGAIFALAQANDPEALVILELAKSPPAWSYGVARTSSQRMRVRLDDKEVWTTKGYWSNPRSRNDPYQEATDGKYPEAP
jgi:hypothetical protein